jgi:hypothetical protein
VRAGAILVILCALLLAGCGGDSGGGGDSVAIIDQDSAETAYREAYTPAWIQACKKALADIRKTSPNRAARVSCDRPVEQMEGNTAFDTEQARAEGREQGTFDGCAYAWDEAYAASGGEVQPRC